MLFFKHITTRKSVQQVQIYTSVSRPETGIYASTVLSFECAILEALEAAYLRENRAQQESAPQQSISQPVQSFGLPERAPLMPWGRLFKVNVGNSTQQSTV